MNDDARTLWLCTECGHEWPTPPASEGLPKQCPRCGGEHIQPPGYNPSKQDWERIKELEAELARCREQLDKVLEASDNLLTSIKAAREDYTMSLLLFRAVDDYLYRFGHDYLESGPVNKRFESALREAFVQAGCEEYEARFTEVIVDYLKVRAMDKAKR